MKQVTVSNAQKCRLRDLRGSMLERARKYLVAIGKFKKPNPTIWEQIDLFFKIRHVIVHVGGFTLGSNHQQAIERFSKGRDDLRIEHGCFKRSPATMST
jgi:hypothetical protein